MMGLKEMDSHLAAAPPLRPRACEAADSPEHALDAVGGLAGLSVSATPYGRSEDRVLDLILNPIAAIPSAARIKA